MCCSLNRIISKIDVQLAAERQKKEEKAVKESERSRRKSSGDGKSPHRSSSHRSPHRSSRHHYDDDKYRSSRHRDRYRDRSFSPPPLRFSHEMEYRARLREYDRMRGGVPPPPFRDPYFDPLGPVPRDLYMHPRDDPYFHERYPPLPPHLPPMPGPHMRDPYGPPPPPERMGPPPERMGPPPDRMAPPPPERMAPPSVAGREALYDRPNPSAHSLTPPSSVSERKERTREILRSSLREREMMRETLREKQRKEVMMDMEIIVVNKQQK